MAARGEVAGAVGLTQTPYNTGDSARTRNQPSRQPPGAKTEYRAGVVLAPLPTQQQVESMVQATICRRRRPDGIVALARRLVIDLWRYVEFGVVPEGARLKVPVANSSH